jgi:hypothetical protein
MTRKFLAFYVSFGTNSTRFDTESEEIHLYAA